MIAEPSWSAAVRTRLAAVPGLEMRDDESSLRAAGLDFGGLVEGSVAAIVRPSTVDALAAVVTLARDELISLTPRGMGNSQSGQSIPQHGVTIDTSAFQAIEVDARGGIARCGSAVTWRQLLARTSADGWTPMVMPLNLDLSIGGTLCAGGMGSTSHRHGMAVSSVESVEAVIGTGERVLASATNRRDVYDAILGGVGHFGLICSVELRLRPLQPSTRTFYLLYDDAPTMLADQRQLMEAAWCTHLEGFASAALQGLRQAPTGKRVPFARWFYGLHVGVEFSPGAEPARDECLAGLSYRELVHTEDCDSVQHASRYDLRFELMRATGAWQQPHLWVEALLPSSCASHLVPDLVAKLPLFLGDGHRIMPIADVPRPALLMQPAESPAVGLAVLPASVPPMFAPMARAALRELHDRVVSAGGKRYLSGWLFEPDESAWRLHFGEHFDTWRSRKQALDPAGVFSSCLFRRQT